MSANLILRVRTRRAGYPAGRYHIAVRQLAQTGATSTQENASPKQFARAEGFMALTIFEWTTDPAARRFVVWMAIGTGFILALAAADFFSGAPIG
jgi:hypothetical protein